jgi:hypothetical protein
MAARSSIEWTDASWTPIRARLWENRGNEGGKERFGWHCEGGKERFGWHCEHVSEGCRAQPRLHAPAPRSPLHPR